MSLVKTKKNQIVGKVSSTIGFYLTLFLILINDYLNAGVDAEKRIAMFQGISLLTLACSVGFAFILDSVFRKILLGKIGIFYFLFLSLYTLMGWYIFNNDFVFIRSDIQAFSGLFIGLAIFRLIVKSYCPKLQLLAFIIFPTWLLLYSTTQTIIARRLEVAGIEQRVVTFLDARYSSLLEIPSSIALAILSRISFIWAMPIWGAIFCRAYLLGFLNAKRTILLSILVLVVLSLMVLSYKASNGFLNNSSSVFSSRNFKILLMALFILVVFIFFNDFNTAEVFQDTLLYKRFYQTESGDRSSELRIEEVISGIQSLQDIEFLVGRGIGANYWTPVRSEMTNHFHIGIFNFLLKGGLILFSVVSYFLFVYFPYLFIKAASEPKSFDPKKRTALLSVLPGLFAWIIVFLTTGHAYPQFYIGLGFGIAAYLHIKKYGLTL
jgi:hypothetical protein